MESIATAEAVSALAFIVIFGACLLVPLFRAPCAIVKYLKSRSRDNG